HELLSAALSPYHRRTHFQENLFFDGPNAELVSNLATLRLRFYDLDSRCVLSLRSKPRIKNTNKNKDKSTLITNQYSYSYITRIRMLND
ncbi:triphosphate tunel metalloenzyme 3, partial [Phtheirospermum japonicum]